MKKILFLTASMGCGGVESTLINLLTALDKKKYKIDLMLIKKNGEFLNRVPKNINIKELEINEIMRTLIYDYGNTIRNESKYLCEKKQYLTLIIFILFKLINKISMFFLKRNFLYFIALKSINLAELKYDIVCDYHGYAYFTTYLAAAFDETIDKYSWIHEENINASYSCIKNKYNKFNAILGVSKECINNFQQKFINFDRKKLIVLHNIVFADEIRRKANQPVKTFYKEENKPLLVSIGRLSVQKGFDLAVETANLLKDDGIDFKWIIVGDGEEKEKLNELIDKYNLKKYLILHGFEQNPFPYLKQADIYIQPSRYEGYATTITEAIILGKPIIATTFSGVREQVIPDFNGYIVDFDRHSLYDKLKNVILSFSIQQKLGEGSKKFNLDLDNSIRILNELFNK